MQMGRNFKTFMLIYVLAGIYVFIFGGSGILERITLSKKQEALLSRIEKLEGDKKALESKLEQYAAGQLTNDDFLNAGYVPPEKRVLMLKGLDKADSGGILTDNRMEQTTGLWMTHLRVLWGVVALLIILFYFSRKKKEADDTY